MEEGGPSSNLAIVEKKEPPRRPGGGCVGVFFQLFDWKKKHFSKKLLPSVTAAKRVLKKFGGHEKLPAAKHLLVHNENGGGFSAVKRSGSCNSSCSSQRSPGLVARLMGLESMPLVHHGSTKNALHPKVDGVVDKSSNLEGTGRRKVVSRPHELRTGRLFKSHGKFSSDALELDLSLEQQRKLALLVRSQRASSRRKKVRLMEVATKILEPGLQSRNRARYAIDSVGVSSNNAEGSDAKFLSSRPVGSCVSCGNLVEVMDLRSSGKLAQELDCRCSASESDDGSSSPSSLEVPEANKLERLAVRNERSTRTHPFERECVKSSLIMENSGRREAPLAVEADLVINRRTKKNLASNLAFKQKNLSQKQLPSANEKFISLPKEQSQRHSTGELNAMRMAKRFEGSNTSSDSRTPFNNAYRTSPEKVIKRGKGALEKTNRVPKSRIRRKYQSINGEMSDATFVKQRNCSTEPRMQKVSVPADSIPKSRNRVRSESLKLVESSNGGKRESSSMSPRICPKVKHTSKSARDVVESSKYPNEPIGCTSFLKEHVTDVADYEILSLEDEQYAFTKVQEDGLFSNLEEKTTDNDNLQTENDFPGVSALFVLEKMISSLSNKGLPYQKNGDNLQGSHRHQDIQDDEKTSHPAPAETLEAPISSDKCSISRPSRGTGISSKFQIDKFPTNIISKQSINRSYTDETRLKKTKFSYPADATTKARSPFQKALGFDSSSGRIQSVMDLFLEDAIGSRRLITSKGYMGVLHEGNPPRQLLLDCVVECLDSLYSYFYYTGCRSWLRFQMLLNKNRLTELIEEEIMSWDQLDGKSLVEIIELDFRNPKSDWPAFKVGGLELSEQIGDGIFELLVIELVLDLLPTLD